MNADVEEYVRYRLTRAHETLEDAKLVLDRGHLHSAVNRLYYGCFYAVSALLFTEGLSSTKHSGIRSLFDRHWIKTERLPIGMSRFYRALFNHRQQADYADRITFSEHDVHGWFDEATEFVDRIAAETEKQLTHG